MWGEGRQRSPYSHATNVKAVSQIGQSLGNHITERTFTVNPIENVHAGVAFRHPSPKPASTIAGVRGSTNA